MMSKMKKLFIVLAVIAASALIFSTPALAADCGSENSSQQAICEGVGQTGGQSAASGTTINNLIRTVINFLSIGVGLLAVVMIIVGGFKYITSGGDSNKVASAKKTIIYSVIGLVVAFFAQILVQTVLNEVSNPGGPNSGGNSIIES